MGRPREHDDATRAALLAAAERIVEQGGVEALQVRRVADEVDTTTRAVYSLFGSKEGLLVALGARAFEQLGQTVLRQRLTPDHRHNLAIAGLGFRTFALEHPALFRIGIQRSLPDPSLAGEFAGAALSTFGVLKERVQRFVDAEGLSLDVDEAAVQYHALCEGLAAVELRGAPMRPGSAARQWRTALAALVDGFALRG